MTTDSALDPPSPDEAPGAHDESLIVVGIGASAGGLHALRSFFEAVHPDSGMAYVVITHLDPDRRSEMAELIQTRTTIPVEQATDALVLEPDHAYVIPPNQELRLEGRTLRLTERTERGLHTPVDLFFRTLAETCGSRAVGVLLSGTGRDGTDGLGRIKEAGGVTVAQAPEDAEYDGMPRSAIATGLVDLVLPAPEIPGELRRLVAEGLGPGLEEEGSGEPTRTRPVDGEETTAFRQILAHLRSQTGHDFSLYKTASVRRRIERRAGFSGLKTLTAYRDLVRRDPDEVRALLKDLMISVSGFFRDPEAFKILEREVIPGLFEGKTSDDRIRVWVPGCATGEEAYSIAILLHARAMTLHDPPHIQIFASDIDEDACAVARAGRYPPAIAADVDPEHLKRFFVQDEDGYRVVGDVRSLVLVARHDLLRDPPFSDLDLVSCRNVLIYFQAAAQAHALATFHYALRPKGHLFLGASESTQAFEGLFAVRDKKYRIFQRAEVEEGNRPPIRRFWRGPLDRGPPARDDGEGGQTEIGASWSAPRISTAGELHLRLLEAYAPPSLVVDEARKVVHLSPRAGDYLGLGGGEATLDVLQLATGQLQSELRTALYQALDKGRATRRAVKVEALGDTRWVDLVVRPLRVDAEVAKGGDDNYALVVFEERAWTDDGMEAPVRGDRPGLGAEELEGELERTRTQLREVVEERQDTVEELQAAIEELQSINEEQKATGEELETSREELQSTNEELTTVNQEYRTVISELNQVNADLRNLMGANEIGTVFLDRQLRVRRFTPAITSLIHLVDADRGRPLADLSHRLEKDDLMTDAQRVLASLDKVEREVRSVDGAWYTLRIIPYRNLDDRIEGVVISFFDITRQKQVELELRDAARLVELERSRLSGLIEHMPAATVVVEASSGRILSTNVRLRELLHDEFDAPEVDGLLQLAVDRDGNPMTDDRWPVTRALRDGEMVQDEEITFHLSDGSSVTLLASTAPLLDPNDRLNAIVMTLVDITRRLEMEDELRRAKKAAEAADLAKSAFMSTVSHELRTPLNAILGYAELLLLTGPFAGPERMKLERMKVATAHLSGMLEELLEFGRLEEGQMPLRSIRFDARSVVDEASSMVELLASEKGLEFSVDLPDQPVELVSDPDKVRQLLISLLGNAVKFTDEGKVGLALRTEGESAFFDVRDTGIGVAPEHQELIFERFWQVGDATPLTGPGTGIGLAVARRLSRLLGGDVTVESDLDRGSVFTLRLPLAGVGEENGASG
jgi:two-component system, chemotaxis family, CheB/CheR fusion protein